MPAVVSGWCPPFPLPCRMQYFSLHLPRLQPLLWSLEGSSDSNITTEVLDGCSSQRASLRRARGRLPHTALCCGSWKLPPLLSP